MPANGFSLDIVGRTGQAKMCGISLVFYLVFASSSCTLKTSRGSTYSNEHIPPHTYFCDFVAHVFRASRAKQMCTLACKHGKSKCLAPVTAPLAWPRFQFKFAEVAANGVRNGFLQDIGLHQGGGDVARLEFTWVCHFLNQNGWSSFLLKLTPKGNLKKRHTHLP